MVLIGVVAILAVIYGVLVLAAEPVADYAFYDQAPARPWVIAHQGGDGLWPGNTMYAFERSVDMGADVLEMDLHGTIDGHFVLMHDETVDRTTDGSGELRSLTLSDIKQLDAGYDWTVDDGESYPFRGQDITIPTLDEIFAAFPNQLMNIEIKQSDPSIVGPFCQKIEEYDMVDRVLVASFDQGTLDAFREVCPDVATSTGQSEVTLFFVLSTLLLERVISPDATALQVPEYQGSLKVLTNRLVDAASNRNLEVHAWTINDEADMERMLDFGLDGIITDYPDRLLSVLDR
jgi:glycerophosphoryl diester phosphodiesterase